MIVAVSKPYQLIPLPLMLPKGNRWMGSMGNKTKKNVLSKVSQCKSLSMRYSSKIEYAKRLKY